MKLNDRGSGDLSRRGEGRPAPSGLGLYLLGHSPFTPVLGGVRSLLALATLLTLLWTPTEQLFYRSSELPNGVRCELPIAAYSLFCVGSEAGSLGAVKWGAIAILAFVVSGFLPAVSALPHWYVTWSLMSASNAIDGGEHLAACLTLILVPITVLDRRRWHWKHDEGYLDRPPWVRFAAYGSLGIFILQMMGVYFQASIAKMSVLEWADGTALWYWMQNPTFGPPGALGDVIAGLMQFLPFSVAATYGTLALQLCLAVGQFWPRAARRTLLALAVLFHLMIASTMGLWSFSMIMIAADAILLLRPDESCRRERPPRRDPVHAPGKEG